jgi:hypothetical protein
MSRQIYAVYLKCLFSLVLLLSIVGSALAQSTAAINGLVQDTSDALIPNAKVKLINIATGTESNSTTNKSGSFVLPGVMPGHYTLQIEREGFDTTQLTGITLNVGDNREVVIRMKVGSKNETVTVDGSGLQINTVDGSVSTIIDRKFVENIPLNGRSFQELIQLTPGVITQSPQNTSQHPGASGEFSVNGQRTESNVYTVDGVSANTGGYIYGYGTSGTSGNLPAATALGTTQSLISVDALQEFRVASSSYSAEYGLSPGGQFSFATRSGTNEPHGTVFDYLRNNYFDANDWFNNNLGLSSAAERQNDFGGTLGGPIWIPRLYDGKNKSFFFVSYEGLRLTQPTAASVQYVPTLALRQAAPTPLQPALNAIPKPTGPEASIACDGIAYLCPVGEPIGTPVPSGLATFIENYSLPSSIDSASFRFDQQLTPKLKVFYRFGDTPSSTQSRSLSVLTITRQSSFTHTLGLTSNLSNALVNDFRIGYTANNGSSQNVIDNFGNAQPVDLSGLQGISEPNAESSISIDPQGFGLTLGQSRAVQPQHAWDTVDSQTILSGRHTMKLGIEYRVTASRLQRPTPYVYYFFDSAASIRTGTSDYSGVTIYGLSYPRYTNTSTYFQDDVRMNRRLSLSGGVRWEVNPSPSQTSGELPYLVQGNPSIPSSLVLGPSNTRFWKTTYLNFAPRAGLAYQVHDQPGHETVLRAGGGAFFDTGQENSAQAFGNSPGQSVSAAYTDVSYPLTHAQIYLPVTNPPGSPYGTGYYFPEHLQLPYTFQWNLALEQALGRQQSISLTYVGSNGRRLLTQQLLKGAATAGPNFSEIYLETSGTTSSYNAMQIKFQRTLSKGLQVLASYNWAHSIDFGSQSVAFSVIRGNSDFDVRHNLNLALTYDIHVGSPNRFFREVADHWAVDTRFAARTGFPVIFQGNTIALPDGQQTYSGLNLTGAPIYLYGKQCPDLAESVCPGGRRINPTAFSLPTSGQEGTAPRNFARGFGENQVDMAVRRTFPILEHLNLQFRAEAFNILNHPNFGFIQSTYGNVQFGEATKMLNQSLGTLSPLYQQGGPRSMQFALKLQF